MFDGLLRTLSTRAGASTVHQQWSARPAGMMHHDDAGVEERRGARGFDVF
jgi:hypothetical protein